MNTKLWKNAENDFEKLRNNAFFVKTGENVRSQRDINLTTIEVKINYLVSELNYHTTIFF